MLSMIVIVVLSSCSKETPITSNDVPTTGINSLKATPLNPVSNADAAYNGWLSAYLIRTGGQTYFANSLTDRGRAFFWGQAYDIATVEDAYDRNPTAERKQLVTDLLNTLLQNETTDWTWDTWNDDVEWAVIACIRGYKITGNTAFLNAAANNWNMVWHRGWDSTFGGGIWELMDDRATPSGNKGGLANWPFIIAGVMIFDATNDGWYKDRCNDVYNWARTHCFDPNSGRVYEGTGYNGMTGDDNSYNTGLLTNACESLYRITGNAQCNNDAIKAADHYIGRIGGVTGIMNEDHPNNGSFGCDQVARGFANLANLNSQWNKFGPFLANNCAASWNHRRTDYNFTWNNFSSNTTTGNLWCMEVQGSVTVQMMAQTQGGQLASIGNGTYKIINRQTGTALDAVGNGTANLTAMDVWAYNGGNNQRWNVTSLGNGLYKIIGVGSGRSLNVGGSSTANNSAVVLYDYQGTGNENVYLTSSESGYYSIYFSHSGKALDVNTSNNSVIQWEYNGGNNQQWQFQQP